MRPLSGIKVVELATVVAAPTASRVLCDFGAEVVKIETLAGDEMRRVGVQENVPCEDYKNPLFTVTNSNKKLTAINIKTEAGREIVHKMLAGADVFISNIRMASLRRLGLDYETLAERYPRLIYAHFSGYGSAGESANKPGFDVTAFWLRSGPMSDWQTEGSFPMDPTYAFGDIATSNAFLSGILMALLGRERTGRGTKVESSLYASGIWCNSEAVVETLPPCAHSLNPVPFRPADPFSAYYKCSDGKWIGVFCNEYTRDLPKFANLLGIPEYIEDSRCRDVPALCESGMLEEMTRAVADVVARRSSEEWSRIFTENNISNEVAAHARDVSTDAQAIDNAFVKEVEFKDGLKVMMPMPPVKFSGYEQREYTPTGKIGENTDEVLLALGYSEAEICALKRDKVII